MGQDELTLEVGWVWYVRYFLTVNIMACKSCGSENLHKFMGEIVVHFPGLKNLDKPPVYVCCEVVVCLTCGAAQLAVPEAELRLLQKGNAACAG